MPVEITEIEQARLNDIVDILKSQPGIPTREIVQELRARGYKTASWDGVRREMGALRREGLAASRRHPGATTYGWWPSTPGQADLSQLREFVVNLLKQSPHPLTASEIKAIVRDQYDERVPGKRVANILTSLCKSNTSNIGVVQRAKTKSGGTEVNLYAHGSPKTREKPEAIEVKREFHHQPDEMDEFRNTKTLETIPPDDLEAVLRSAQLMREFRANSRRVSGGAFKPRYALNPSRGCDAPIRALFVQNRNDQLEARYTALALWLSWKEDPNAEAA